MHNKSGYIGTVSSSFSPKLWIAARYRKVRGRFFMLL
jgi:hypothetical protein